MGHHLQEAYILVEKTAQKQPNLKRWHKEKTITLCVCIKPRSPRGGGNQRRMSLQRKHILPTERCWQEAKMSGDTPGVGVGWGKGRW